MLQPQNSTTITRNENGEARIDHDALRNVLIRPEIGDRRVAIISIAGRMRTGKSFLLNFVLRYLKEKGWDNPSWMVDEEKINDGFRWKTGKQRETVGIMIWNEVFYVPQDGERSEMAVLLMDTQGLFDQSTSKQTNTSLLTLSTLASSVQIFNVKDNLDTNDMEYLKTCVDFALATAREKEPFFKLQSLNFLVRDAPEEYEKDSYGFDEIYLKDTLDSKGGGEENIRVREGMKASFSKVDCFLLPSPGNNASKNKFEGKNKELEHDFKEWVKRFVEATANPKHLQPKQSRSSSHKSMTAREILNMVVACDKLFAKRMYEAKDLIQANIQVYYTAEYEKCLLEYEERIKEIINKEQFYINDKKLSLEHEAVRNLAIERYRKAQEMGDGKERKKSEEHLISKIDEYYQQTKIRNDFNKENYETKKEKNTRDAITELYNSLEKMRCGGYLEPNQIDVVYNQHVEEIRQKYMSNPFDEKRLNIAMENYHNEILAANKEKGEMEERAKKNEEVNRLHNLRLRLEKRNSMKWNKITKKLQTRESIENHAKELEKLILDEYSAESMTVIQKKYFDLILHGISEEFQKAIDRENRVGQRATGDSQKDSAAGDEKQQNQRMPDLPSEERSHHHFVTSLIEKYEREVQSDMAKGTPISVMRKNKDEAIRLYREEYMSEMCNNVLQHWDGLKSNLDRKRKEAMRQNDANLKNVKRQIECSISEMILVEEEKLYKIMMDRYIDGAELRAHYDIVNKRFRDQMSSPSLEIVFTIPDKDTILIKWEENLQKSLDKMNSANEGARAHHIVKTKVIEEPSILLQIWHKIKNLFVSEKVELIVGVPVSDDLDANDEFVLQ